MLPKAKSLEWLPLRAVAAYAARTARRLSIELRGLISDDVLDNVLDRTDQAHSTPFLSEIDISQLMNAIADLYDELKVLEHTHVNAHLAGLCIARSATVARMLVDAGLDPTRAKYHMGRAVKKAEKSVSAIDSLSSGAAAAREAACRDFEILSKEYGLHDDVVIGDPVDCFTDDI